jgi:predicted molibdopterin-dependent oxidoreductase YjgC
LGRLRRVAEHNRPVVEIVVDGVAVSALAGDSLLVAVLASGRTLRRSEFDAGARAGFCLMGACQDCWMWTADGQRVRACTTPVRAGMRLVTQPVSEDLWPNPP